MMGSRPQRSARRNEDVFAEIRAEVADYGFTERDIFGRRRVAPRPLVPLCRPSIVEAGATYSQGPGAQLIKDVKSAARCAPPPCAFARRLPPRG